MKLHQIRLFTIILFAIAPTVMSAMEEEWVSIEKENEQKTSSAETEKIKRLVTAAEKVAASKPITHYIYTPGMIWGGAYEKGPGDFSATFLASMRAGAKIIFNMQLQSKNPIIEKATLEAIINLINFCLFAALADNKNIFDFDNGLTIKITSESTKNTTLQKLFNFFTSYVKSNPANNLYIKEAQMILISLRPDPSQNHRSYWLGNKKFKSFEILYLSKENTLIIRPTDENKLIVTNELTQTFKKKDANIVTIKVQDLNETAQASLFNI